MSAQKHLAPLAALFALLVALLVPAPALAADNAPVVYLPYQFTVDVDDLTISQQEATVGDTIHFTLPAQSILETTIQLNYAWGTGYDEVYRVRLTDPERDGLFEGDFTIYDGTAGGTWQLASIHCEHMGAHMGSGGAFIRSGTGTDSGTDYFRDLSAFSITVDNDECDVTPPQVDLGTLTISARTATMGDTLTFTVNAYDDFGMSSAPGAGVNLWFYGDGGGSAHVNLRPTDTHTCVGTLHITEDLRLASGHYTLDYSSVTDDVGNQQEVWGNTDVEFDLVNMPSYPRPSFYVNFNNATRTPADDTIAVGTEVTVSIPATSTNGIVEAVFEYRCNQTEYSLELHDAGNGRWEGSIVVPDGASGVWEAYNLRVLDKSDTSSFYWSERTNMRKLDFTVASDGVGETNPPVIDTESWTVSPKVIHGSWSYPTLTVNVTDDTKVEKVVIDVRSPSGTLAYPSNNYNMHQDDPNSSTWIAYPFVSNAETGDWSVDRIIATDLYGNETIVRNERFYPGDPNACDLSALDYTRVNEDDGEPPVIDASSITVSPKRATAGDVVTFSVRITDPSGVDGNVYMNVCPVEMLQMGSTTGFYLSKGDDDVWTGSFAVLETDRAGEWCVAQIVASDSYGNRSAVINDQVEAPFTADFSAANFEVFGTAANETPPELVPGTAMVVPKKVGLGEQLLMAMEVRDDQPGFPRVTVLYRDPTGQLATASSAFFTDGLRMLLFPPTNILMLGDYTAVSVSLTDDLGNISQYARGDDDPYGLAGLDFTFVDTAESVSLSNATIEIEKGLHVYDGSEHRVSATVTLGGKTLVEGTDYEITYVNNVNAGTARVVFSGLGSYRGYTGRNFLIFPRPLSETDIEPEQIPAQAWAGEAIEPEVTVTCDGTELMRGTDYKARYADNGGIGTATLTLRGRGNFTGTVEMPFDIVDPAATIPMFRLYNRWTYEHFYCASEEEKDKLVSVGWTYEGVGWTAPSTGDPVYRLYNQYAPGGDHHYTMDKSEYDYLVSVGWTGEGIGWYSDVNQTVPVYREYNPYEQAHNHNYTPDRAEHDNLVSLGWKDEGIGWYGV